MAQHAPAPHPTGPIVFENLIDRSGITFKMNNSVTPRKPQIEAMLAGIAVFALETPHPSEGRSDHHCA